MSSKNFVPEIWDARLMQHLDDALVFKVLCNTDYEGAITKQGDTVHVNQIGDVTISPYAPGKTNITVEQLKSVQSILTVDQGHYYAFEVEDVDKVQSMANLLDLAAERAAFGLAHTIDSYLAALYSQAGSSITAHGSTAVNSGNVIGLIGYVGQVMNENNVPTDGRWGVVPPWFALSLSLANILKRTENVGLIKTGYIGSAPTLGFDFYMSNNVVTTGTAPDYTSYCMFGRKPALTFAQQVLENEAYRSHTGFADVVRGLLVYGAKVMDPRQLVSMTATYTTEIGI
jgi:hypothetical protein